MEKYPIFGWDFGEICEGLWIGIPAHFGRDRQMFHVEQFPFRAISDLFHVEQSALLTACDYQERRARLMILRSPPGIGMGSSQENGAMTRLRIDAISCSVVIRAR